MFVDFHIHEKTNSHDSFLSLEEIVSAARLRGLDGICITDHESLGLTDYARQYARAVDFPIFVGVEYLSLQGDIVAFGVDRVPAGRIDAQHFVNQVKRAGGICFSAHPFRNNNRGLEEHLLAVQGLDGVEVRNGSTAPEANAKALEYCKALGLQPIGASDAHVKKQVGVYATYLPEYVETVPELIAAVRAGGLRAAVHTGNGYEIQSYAGPQRHDVSA